MPPPLQSLLRWKSARQKGNTSSASTTPSSDPPPHSHPISGAMPPPPPPRPSIESPSYRVHLDYDPAAPPPVPGPGWTRFVCISDTHSQTHFPVPHGDVLIHAGDLTGLGRLNEFQKTMEWIYGMEHKVKLVIAGNHDMTLHRSWYEAHRKNYPFGKSDAETSDYDAIIDLLKGPRAKENGVVYLECSSHTFQIKDTAWRVYGFPWQPAFGSWAFNYEPGDEAEALVSSIPPTDILLTHGPPHGILDFTIYGKSHAGCPTLLAHLPRIRPRLHVFGHIHESHGAEVHAFSDSHGSDGAGAETVTVNAANAPMGMYARSEGGARTPFGTGWFRPIIVDLQDVQQE